MKKFLIVLLAIVLLVVVIDYIIMPHIYPIRRSWDGVRDYILTLTPIGTDRDNVEEFINERENWRIVGGSRSRGVVVPGPLTPPPIPDWPITPVAPREQSVIGESHITADIGSYRALRRLFILEVNVRVYWAFDADGKLIEVLVEKFFMF